MRRRNVCSGAPCPALGIRFADYLVVDAGLLTATFLHTATEMGLPVLARLKGNLPELAATVQQRFGAEEPHRVLTEGKDVVELWDADDFDPWETLQWPTVRVLRYRLLQPDGTQTHGDWLTNLPAHKVPSLSVFRMGRSRWEIENEGFNDCKSRQGFEHICHHHRNSLLLCWLLTLLALVIGRLFRIRYLHRGSHPVGATGRVGPSALAVARPHPGAQFQLFTPLDADFPCSLLFDSLRPSAPHREHTPLFPLLRQRLSPCTTVRSPATASTGIPKRLHHPHHPNDNHPNDA